MKTSLRRVVCLLAVTAMVTLTVQAAEEKVIKGWGTVTDPDGDCELKNEDDSVTITIPGKHHDLTHTAAYIKLNAPRILQPAEGDFTLELKTPRFALPADAKSSGGKFSFVSTGLLLWQDEKNFIRLERASVAGVEEPFVWVEGFQDGKSVFQGMKRVSDKETGLRITRTDKKLKYYYDDGAVGGWSEIEGKDVDIPTTHAGVAAINTTNLPMAYRLSGLKLDGKK
jgi:hypothetical protein